MRILIIADDLSGAADCAAAAGPDGLVLLQPERGNEADIVAVDNDSRSSGPEIAGRRAGAGLETLLRPETAVVYQKVDSTLRGNWPAELAALRAAVQDLRGYAPLAVVAPALPDKGRTTKGGLMFLDGQPLTSAAHAADQGAHADIVGTLARSGLGATALPAGEGVAALTARMREAVGRGIGIVVCDAASRGDLDDIATAGLTFRQVLWVGSSGLMGSLGPRHVRSAAATTSDWAVAGSIAVIIGSASPVSREQFRMLRAEPGLVPIEIAAGALRDSTGGSSLSQAVEGALAAGQNVAIAIAAGENDELATGAALTAALARRLAPQLGRFGGLVLTGGETARAVLSAAGVQAIRLGGEIEAGVPFGLTIGRLAVPVVTKAGAFGAPETLVRVLRRLQAMRPGDRQVYGGTVR